MILANYQIFIVRPTPFAPTLLPSAQGEILPMLWWLVGLWLASPVLLPIFWLLGSLRGAPQEKPETAAPAELR